MRTHPSETTLVAALKTRRSILILLFCSVLVTPMVFGQQTRIWTGGINGTNTGTDIGLSNNWGGILPSTANGDTGEWDGSVPGNLDLSYNTISLASGFTQSGVNFYLSFAQTGSVSISTTLGTQPTIAIQNITIEAGAGAFTFGGRDNQHVINWVGRPAGFFHTFINNSTHTATLTPWIAFTSGGGSLWTIDFSGTGNWECDSYFVDVDGPGRAIQVDGPGNMIWNPVGFLGANGIASPIVINGGALVLRGPHPRLKTQAITLNGNFTFAPTNTAATQTLSGIISGVGTLTVNSGALTLLGTNTYTGGTYVSNGTLSAYAAGGDMNVNGGRLSPGGIGVVGTLTVGSNMNISAGAVLVTLNKSLPQPNNMVAVAGSINYTGGTLKLTNAGPRLAVGDKFSIFNKPVIGGDGVTIDSPGCTFANNLAADGSVTVATVVPATPTLSGITFDGSNIVIIATNNTGSGGGTYALLATNDFTAPVTNWPVLGAGTFDSNGNLAITNAIGTNRLFYILRVL